MAAAEIEDLLKEEESAIFEKNRWLKRMESLGSDGIRETIESQHEGVDTFSSEFLRVGENLGLLGVMGKELKSSIADV